MIPNYRDILYFCAPKIGTRDVAQLVAYHVRDVGVAGSNPVIPTTPKSRPGAAFWFWIPSTQRFAPAQSAHLFPVSVQKVSHPMGVRFPVLP